MLQRIFLAQQEAALNHYNTARNQEGWTPSAPAPAPQPNQQQQQQAPPAGPNANPIFSMISGVMESLADSVIPVAGPNDQAAETGPPPASSQAVKTIPSITVTPDDLSDPTNLECCICLEKNELGSKVSRLPCGHLFHEDCLKAWITKHCTCPVCRYELPSTSTDFNAGRSARMASRKPRYHKYELERMSGGELMRLARELGVVSTSSSAGVSDKAEVVSMIISSGKIDVIPGGAKKVELTSSQLASMKIKDLRNVAKEQGVHYNEQDVLERADLVEVLVNSGRVGIIASEGEESMEEEGKGGEGKEDGKEEEKDFFAMDSDGPEEKASASNISREESFQLGSTGIHVSELESMRISQLKAMCRENSIDISGVVEKAELVRRIVDSGVILVADF